VSGAFQAASKHSKYLPLLCVLLVMTGCATRQAMQLPAMPDWATRSRVLGGANSWEFSGRIAVSTGDDGFNGKIRWQQDGDTFEATVGGPLGIGTVHIAGDGRSVIHTDKDGVRTELQDAEQELLARYGWTIPVASLRYWALGLPDPSTAAQTELNSNAQLAKLVQGAWTVQITRYRDSNGQSMPNLLSASSATTRVRIVFDKWLFFD
jgi:outer membrane lipoprotein LolB